MDNDREVVDQIPRDLGAAAYWTWSATLSFDLPRCFRFFSCQWQNELSISAISRVGCVSGANSVICGRSAELFSNFGKLEAANQLPAAASTKIRANCSNWPQRRSDLPLTWPRHRPDLKINFQFLKKEAPPTRVEEGASHAPASWPFRPFELELRNETLTIAFSAFDSTWQPNFINFVLSADFLSNFSFISSIKSLGSELNQMKFLKWYSDR